MSLWQRDYFYYKEHLLIVTELLRDSLYQFYKFVDSTDSRGIASFFSSSTIAKIAVQLLKGLDFIHTSGFVHCDIKPENVCLVSASRCLVKIIDFGTRTSRGPATKLGSATRVTRAFASSHDRRVDGLQI